MIKKDKSLIVIGLLNFLIFQWFFVRIALCVDPPMKDYITARRPLHILYWILPISGWFGIKYFPHLYRSKLIMYGLDYIDPNSDFGKKSSK
jgi:hypothetical protein